MNELMYEEILDQPQAIRESLPQLRSQLSAMNTTIESRQRIVFTGSGDSYFAPLALLFAARRNVSPNVHVVPALEAAAYYPFSERDLLVPISVSGRAVRTVDAAQNALKGGASVLSITANADSPLAELSHNVVRLPFKSRSRVTPHTTDYLTSLLAIAVVLEHFAGTEFEVLNSLEGTVAELVRSYEQIALELGGRFRDKERFYFLGGGPHFAAAGYTAAKFWEAGGLHAIAFDLEEFAHGPHFVVDPHDPVLLIAPCGGSLARAKQIISGLRKLSVDLYMVTDIEDDIDAVYKLSVPSVPEEWTPFTTSIPLQWLSWAVATAKEYDVLKKDGRHDDPELYEAAHHEWVRPISTVA